MNHSGDQPTGVALAGDRLREVFGCFPSGVVALCALVDDTPVGMAVSSFTSVSLDPPLVSFCVQNTSATWPVLRRRPWLGISVLAEHHDQICRTLSRKHGDRFAGVDWTAEADGSMLVGGSSAWLVGQVHAEVAAGDHALVLLRIDRLGADPDTAPLVFHGGGFRRLAETTGTRQGSGERVAG
jgi:flavin reductase (DIM6/NTAB) family NADH-FMN oxidoreductase RutF